MSFIDIYFKKGICYLIVLSPILSIYASPIGRIDLLTLMVIPVFIFLAIKTLHRKKIFIYRGFDELLKYMVYISVTTFISALLGYNDVEFSIAFLRMGKQILYILTVLLIITTSCFDIRYATKLLGRISAFLSIYLIFQKLIYELTGILLPFLFSKEFIREEYIGYLESYEYWAKIFFRPSSFFLEPAHYFQYIIVFFIYLLFKNDKFSFKDSMKFTILVFGILFSTSGQGIMISLGLFIFYFFFTNKKKEFYLFLCFLITGFIFVFETIISNEFIYIALTRIFEGGLDGNNAIIGRTYSYAIIKDMPIYMYFTGYGFGGKLETIYFNSIAYHFIYTGLIGTFLIGKICFSLFKQGNKWQKVLVCIFFVMNFFAALFTGPDLLYYLPFIIKQRGEKL